MSEQRFVTGSYNVQRSKLWLKWQGSVYTFFERSVDWWLHKTFLRRKALKRSTEVPLCGAKSEGKICQTDRCRKDCTGTFIGYYWLFGGRFGYPLVRLLSHRPTFAIRNAVVLETFALKGTSLIKTAKRQSQLDSLPAAASPRNPLRSFRSQAARPHKRKICEAVFIAI